MQAKTITKNSSTIRRSRELEFAKIALRSHLTGRIPLNADAQRGLLLKLVPALNRWWNYFRDEKTVSLVLKMLSAGWKIRRGPYTLVATLENRRGKSRVGWSAILKYAEQNAWISKIESEHRILRRTLAGRVAWEIPAIAKRTKHLTDAALSQILKMSRRGGWEFDIVDGVVVGTLNRTDCRKSISECQVVEYAERGLPLDKIESFAGCTPIELRLEYRRDWTENINDNAERVDKTGCEQYKEGIKNALAHVESGKNVLEIYALGRAGFHEEASAIEEVTNLADGAGCLYHVFKKTNEFLRNLEMSKHDDKTTTQYSFVLGRNYAPFNKVLVEQDTREFIARAKGDIVEIETAEGVSFEYITDFASGEVVYLISDSDYVTINGVLDKLAAKEVFLDHAGYAFENRLCNSINTTLGLPPAPSDDIPF